MTTPTPATGDPGGSPPSQASISHRGTTPPNTEKIRLEFKANVPLFDAWTALMAVFTRFQQADPSLAVHPKSTACMCNPLTNFKAKSGNESKFHWFFNHSVTNKNGDGARHWITCFISSKKPVTSLKHESQAWLKTNNVYVYKHPFKQTTISAAGYLFGVHPYHVHRDMVVNLLNNQASTTPINFI